jgi:hypothetical protein
MDTAYRVFAHLIDPTTGTPIVQDDACLVEHLFPISAIRVPDRFNLLTVFSLAVSAGLGTAQLEKRRSWLLIPLILLVIVECLCIPIPMLDLLPGSPFLTQMAQEPPTYAVVDYPMGYTASKRWLYYQTLHGKPRCRRP